MQIWKELKFKIDQENNHLIPPVIESEADLHFLLRAWVELSAYTAEYIRAHRKSTIKYRNRPTHVDIAITVTLRQREGVVIHKVWVKVNSASDEIADLFGSHPNQSMPSLVDFSNLTFSSTPWVHRCPTAIFRPILPRPWTHSVELYSEYVLNISLVRI